MKIFRNSCNRRSLVRELYIIGNNNELPDVFCFLGFKGNSRVTSNDETSQEFINELSKNPFSQTEDLFFLKFTFCMFKFTL